MAVKPLPSSTSTGLLLSTTPPPPAAAAAPSLGAERSAVVPDDAPPPTSLLATPTLSPPSMSACMPSGVLCAFVLTQYVLYVCVFFPICSGHQIRWKYLPGSHRISHPPSSCGACLNLSREKDSAIHSFPSSTVIFVYQRLNRVGHFYFHYLFF